MLKFLVTGGAGFIGSHFVDHALRKGHQVFVFDDLSTGQEYFLTEAKKSKHYHFIKGDIRELEQITAAATDFKPDWMIHFAANADVRLGLTRPRRDLEYNTIGTWNVLEATRKSGCQNFLFSSTGSVYGEPQVFPTPENASFPVQTSLYGASKLAGEGLISAYTYGYNLNALVFRFVSILGPRYSHGHIVDFAKKLKQDPSQIEILGNGQQLKSYLHVDDLMQGLWLAIENQASGFRVYNIGHDEALRVEQSLELICEYLKLKPKKIFSGGERGWIGDSPRIQLDTSSLKKLGWKAKYSLRDAVLDTIKYLDQNLFLYQFY